MARAIILCGGNADDMKTRLQQAQRLINLRVGPVLHCSHRYKSRAWGFEAEREFSNQVLEADTEMSPEELLDTLQRIETELGRDRQAEAAEKQRTGARYASRALDLDILFYDDRIIRTDRLTIPHPLLQEREFALVPLCERMRDFRHPVLGKTIGELLEALKRSEENHEDA
ncbi:MAG: 2-amino-4-hydroxy-6-hydroxymethyldihydropteridine diphosphokinase [Alistipes sp.]|nr:2-amino-4-hydroxy-6-hydroxymethyldihydropteridine diphosphokinase [Alistipes sp.]MDE7069364.1 2-amino-4-hydroxy-6-hydroxymethyldihydropteridine diphosphokinase [Alistipes sp.]